MQTAHTCLNRSSCSIASHAAIQNFFVHNELTRRGPPWKFILKSESPERHMCISPLSSAQQIMDTNAGSLNRIHEQGSNASQQDAGSSWTLAERYDVKPIEAVMILRCE